MKRTASRLSATFAVALTAIAGTAPSASAQQNNPTAIGPVDVTDQRIRPQQKQKAAPAARTQVAPESTPTNPGGVDGYVANQSTTATRTSTPLINVPQAITVITPELIADRAMRSVADALLFVPGVQASQGEGNRDQVVFRGQSTTADFYTNGMRDDIQYYRDFYNIDRLEVLKGPNAMIFGRGGAGGVFNRVQKEANFQTIRDAQVSVGSFGEARTAIDIAGVINPNVAYRLNAMYEYADSFRNGVFVQRYGFNPTFTFLPSDRTRVVLGYEHFHDNRIGDRGIPSLNNRPFPTSRSTFFGNPDGSPNHVNLHSLYGILDHEFQSNINVRSHTRVTYYDKFYQNVYPNGAVSGANTVAIQAYDNANERTNYFNQTDWTLKANLGALTHTFLFGTEIGTQNTTNLRRNGSWAAGQCVAAGLTCTVSAFNPFAPIPASYSNTGLANSETRVNLAAAYVQDQIEINRYLQLIGGVRFERFDIEYQDRNSPTRLERSDNLVSPRVGIVIKPVQQLSFYASYSMSFLPYSGDQFTTLDTTTVNLKPEQLNNREVGLKWDIARNLQFNAALYQLDRENTRFFDGVNTVQTGTTRTDGLELSFNGYVSPLWQIVTAYAYQDAVITSSGTVPAGRVVPIVPEHTFSVWNKYQFTQVFAGAVGVIYQSDSYASTNNTTLLPAYTRVDLAFFYRFNERMRAQLNLENIFDTKYYPHAHTDNNITVGAPFNARFTLFSSF